MANLANIQSNPTTELGENGLQVAGRLPALLDNSDLQSRWLPTCLSTIHEAPWKILVMTGNYL